MRYIKFRDEETEEQGNELVSQSPKANEWKSQDSTQADTIRTG